MILGRSRVVSVFFVATLIVLVGCSIVAFRTYAQTRYNVLLRSRVQDSACVDVGTIVIDNTPYNLPRTLAVAVGDHNINAGFPPDVGPPDCDFVMWEVEGPLAVRDPKNKVTVLTVNGEGGTLRVVFRGLCCRSVGGVTVPTNTYMTLAPYLAVIGLVAVAATVAIKKRRN